MTDLRSELAWLVETFESYNGTIWNDWTGVPGVDERLKAELERAKAILALIDWQPIATAPKDGTRVLLCEVDGEGPSQVKIGLWDGAWTIHEPFEHDWDWTDWMPLPDPPKD